METLVYPNEPLGAWLPHDFVAFSTWCTLQEGISDINLIAGDRAWVRCYGCWQQVTRKALSANSIFGIIDIISADVASSSIIRGGRDIDFNYDLKIDRNTRKRFRCNATGCKDLSGSNDGVNLVLRLIPAIPPTLEELDIEAEIIEHCTPNNGLVLITGVMGTGKSTLLAAILRRIIETQQRYVATFEDPIEFDFLNIPNARSPVSQGEIHKHLLSFNDVSRNSSRRAVDVFLVGESRDLETLKGMVTAAEMGMAVYSTVHTRTVAETLGRIITVFPSDQWNLISTLLINSVRLIIQQRLLPKLGGGRVAIREYLCVTQAHKDELLRAPVEQIPVLFKHFVEQDGLSLAQAAQRAFEAEHISRDTLNMILKEGGGHVA